MNSGGPKEAQVQSYSPGGANFPTWDWEGTFAFECQLLVINAARDSSTNGYTLAIIYRPPSSSAAEFYDDLSDMLDKLGDVIDTDRFVACGDLSLIHI